MLEYN